MLPKPKASTPHRTKLFLQIIVLVALAATCLPGMLAELYLGTPLSDRLWGFCTANRLLLWMCYSTGLIIAFFRFRAKTTERETSAQTGRAPVFEIVLTAVALLNGASPYLGLKTRTSFNMYSNLRIEPGYSNHWLIGRSADILGYMSKSAVVSPVGLNSGQTHVCEYIWVGSPYPLLELARIERDCRGTDFSYEYNGELLQLHSSKSRELLDRHSSYLSRRFTVFKPLDERGATDCIW